MFLEICTIQDIPCFHYKLCYLFNFSNFPTIYTKDLEMFLSVDIFIDHAQKSSQSQSTFRFCLLCDSENVKDETLFLEVFYIHSLQKTLSYPTHIHYSTESLLKFITASSDYAVLTVNTMYKNVSLINLLNRNLSFNNVVYVVQAKEQILSSDLEVSCYFLLTKVYRLHQLHIRYQRRKKSRN